MHRQRVPCRWLHKMHIAKFPVCAEVQYDRRLSLEMARISPSGRASSHVVNHQNWRLCITRRLCDTQEKSIIDVLEVRIVVDTWAIFKNIVQGRWSHHGHPQKTGACTKSGMRKLWQAFLFYKRVMPVPVRRRRNGMAVKVAFESITNGLLE